MINSYDELLVTIADYVVDTTITSELAYTTARHAFLDAIGCGLLALRYQACCKHLGPIVPGTVVPGGVRVLGTSYVLDPVKAAFDVGSLIRWLDFNDTWLAQEWGHPSDNLGAIWAVADLVSQQRVAAGKASLTGKDVLTAMIKAYEIQGVLALENSLNRVGLDHVALVKVASVAVATHLLGGDKSAIMAALSQAWLDGHSLRTYRHSPNTGSRKSWAAGDACSRAVRLALMTLQGEMGYPSVLSTQGWGFQDVCFNQQKVVLSRPLQSYVMENILFKISYPAEFHAQTAVECAIALHPQLTGRIEQIAEIRLTTQEPAVRIISKTGPLTNPADRDHCLQYMVAVALLEGSLTADHYEDSWAGQSTVDQLRKKMVVVENPVYTKDYYDPDKRAIANGIEISFTDGSPSIAQAVDYPVGHRCRRDEGVPLLFEKCHAQVAGHFSSSRYAEIMALFDSQTAFEDSSVLSLIEMLSAE